MEEMNFVFTVDGEVISEVTAKVNSRDDALDFARNRVVDLSKNYSTGSHFRGYIHTKSDEFMLVELKFSR